VLLSVFFYEPAHIKRFDLYTLYCAYFMTVPYVKELFSAPLNVLTKSTSEDRHTFTDSAPVSNASALFLLKAHGDTQADVLCAKLTCLVHASYM